MLEKMMAALDADYLERGLAQGAHHLGTRRTGAGGSRCDRDPLNANKRHWLNLFAFDLQAEFDYFPHALHEFVQGASLCMTSSERRDGCYVVSRRVALDHDIEVSLHITSGTNPCL
jgi:hypothetical protein